jgi:hypothetical protein
MQSLFATFVALHGMIHLVGFTVPWRMNLARGRVRISTDEPDGVEIVDEPAHAPAAVWLVVGFALVAAAVGVARTTVWAAPLLLVATVVSSALSAAGPERVYRGLFADVLIFAFLLV